MAAAKGRVVLVLDALNQLEDRDGAPDLVWLPPVDPGQRAPGPLHAARPVARRDRATGLADAGGRSRSNRRNASELIVELPARSTPRPWARRASSASPSAPQCANPLYLRALLEELRLLGEHETLDGAIDHYLAAATVDALYELILARYEEDYERDRPGLVRRRHLAAVGGPARPVRGRAAGPPRHRRPGPAARATGRRSTWPPSRRWRTGRG